MVHPRAQSSLDRCIRWAPVCLLMALAGCASTLDVRPLATARADQSAFELTGRDLAALRREASLLCPKGGEILRQSAREHRLEAVDSRLERWGHFSSLWITPSERQAQMVVLCHPVADSHLLTAATTLPPLAMAAADGAASGPRVVAAPSAPIGPLSVEW